MKPLEKPVDAARRPGFPLRMPAAANPTGATKIIAGNAREISAKGIKHTFKELQKPYSTATAGAAGLGLDSQAVRTRMVQKLAAQGVTDSRVLAAMGLIERHRFVDSALVNQAMKTPACRLGWAKPSASRMW